MYDSTTRTFIKRKRLMVNTQGCCILLWTNHRSSTQQNKICVPTNLPPHKRSQEDHHDVLHTTEEIRINSKGRASQDSYTSTQRCGPPSKKLYSSVLCDHWMSSKQLSKSDGCCGRISKREWWWWWWWFSNFLYF